MGYDLRLVIEVPSRDFPPDREEVWQLAVVLEPTRDTELHNLFCGIWGGVSRPWPTDIAQESLRWLDAEETLTHAWLTSDQLQQLVQGHYLRRPYRRWFKTFTERNLDHILFLCTHLLHGAAYRVIVQLTH